MMSDAIALSEEQERYVRPKRPFLIHLINFFGVTRDLSVEKLMKTAVRRNKLDNFGGNDFLPAFRVLVDSVNRESRLTPVGRMIIKTRLLNTLSVRLRAEHLFQLHPEILTAKLPPIFVITGLQRTGTTLLHRLMASDPDIRSLSSWEALNPVPYLNRKEEISGNDKKRRMRFAKTAEKGLKFMAPDFFKVHPVEWNAPEEDCLLLDYAFLSTVPEGTYRVPSYSRWVEEQDNSPAYDYMDKMLKLLQWQQPRKYWVLKTPHHQEYLDLLIKRYPGIKIIHTHRDPIVTLTSFSSMVCHGHGVFSDKIDPIEVGEHWLRKDRRLVNRIMEERKKNPGLFFDVYYKELIRDPLGVMKNIYRFLGLDFSMESEQRLSEALKTNRQNKYGKHNYHPADFGFTEQMIREEFAGYYQTFFSKEK